MFVGRPPGNYDRLLDFSRAVTGTLFFVPSRRLLENAAADAASADERKTNEDSKPPMPAPDWLARHRFIEGRGWT